MIHLIKLYAPGLDFSYFLDLVGQAQEPPFSSDITRAEVFCTLPRKARGGLSCLSMAEGQTCEQRGKQKLYRHKRLP